MVARREYEAVAKRDHVLLRLTPGLLDALKQWADDELRSTNAQIEYLLSDAVRRAGRGAKWDSASEAGRGQANEAPAGTETATGTETSASTETVAIQEPPKPAT